MSFLVEKFPLGSLSVFVLVFANLVPVYGIIFLGWSLKSVFYLYFFENIIVGCFGVLHIFQAKWVRSSAKVNNEYQINFVRTKRLTYVFAFLCSYGILVMFHGVLLSIPFPLYDIDVRQMLPGVLD